MRRREFISLLGGATVAWPVAAFAQRKEGPTIGLLSSVPFESYGARVDALRQGLGSLGFTEGSSLLIEYRSSDGDLERLPLLAQELAQLQVQVLVTIGGDLPALAAKKATATIPIVFATGADPVEAGILSSVSRPEANITGVSFVSTQLQAKRVELLRDLLPGSRVFGFLLGPQDSRYSSELMLAVRSAGAQGHFLTASTEQEINQAFAVFVQERVAAVSIANDAILNSRREQIVKLAALHRLPAVYAYREHIRAGGLMSYGTDVNEMFRQAGVYVGRILKGAKPGDLPVQTPSKFELIVNLQVAKALGLDVPQNLLARADEVIE
jgi:putative ABC transport system substrate-binding protein